MVDLTKDADQKHRAWWKIKNKRFLVRIPSYLIPQRETDAHIFGTFSTGHRGADQEMAKQYEQVFLPLIDLINVYVQNGDFTFLKPNNDIPLIHEILQQHIDDFTAAEEMYRRGLYSEDEEVMNQRRRDMIQLDDFAREIYRRAYRKELSKESKFKGFQRLMSPFEIMEAQSKKDIPQYESVSTHVDYGALRNRRGKLR